MFSLPGNQYVFIALCLVLSCTSTYGQKYMVVQNVKSGKSIRFKSGDDLTFKIKDDDHFRTDHIVSLNDSSIVFHYHTINFNEIDEIRLNGQRFGNFDLRGLGTTMQFVGVSYVAIDFFNNNIIRGTDYTPSNEVLTSGAVILLSGTILKLFIPKKVRIGNKYRIKMIEY